MNLPSSSMVLLVPVGKEWCTVEEWQKDEMFNLYYGAKDSMARICHWLYNAKEVEIVRTIRDGENDPVVTTTALYAGKNLQFGQEIVWPGAHPLPWMELSGKSMSTTGLSMEFVQDRWLDANGNLGDNFFKAMVWLGEWYWAPSMHFESGSASALGDKSFEVSGTNGNTEESYVVTMKAWFY